jgi:hypothetical protein
MVACGYSCLLGGVAIVSGEPAVLDSATGHEQVRVTQLPLVPRWSRFLSGLIPQNSTNRVSGSQIHSSFDDLEVVPMWNSTFDS